MLASQAPDVDYGTAPVPVDGAQPDLYGSGYVNGSIIGIPVDADHKAESWKLVKYLATDVGALAKLSNGLRNVPSTAASLASPDLTPNEQFAVFLDIAAHARAARRRVRLLACSTRRSSRRSSRSGNPARRRTCSPACGRSIARSTRCWNRRPGTGEPRSRRRSVAQAPVDRLVRCGGPARLRPAVPAVRCQADGSIGQAQRARSRRVRPTRMGRGDRSSSRGTRAPTSGRRHRGTRRSVRPNGASSTGRADVKSPASCSGGSSSSETPSAR